MNKKLKPTCDICKKLVDRFKHLKKVKSQYHCLECYQKLRKKHKQETIEPIKEKIRLLDNQIAKEHRLNYLERERKRQREAYHKKKPDSIYYNKDKPIIRIKKEHLKRQKSNAYLTLEEKQDLFRILISNELTYDEANIRIKELIKNQKELREILRSNYNKELDSISKQKEMILLLKNSCKDLNSG